MNQSDADGLFQPLHLPCGVVIKNRVAKSAMSDSLGDGRGNPTQAQIRLYQTWAQGGLGLSIIGEVQGDPRFAEKPGNLVLREDSDQNLFKALAQYGSETGCQLWLQLGHAGALAHPPISTPKGPSALDLPGLRCSALSLAEISALPAQFARTARLAQRLGFGGVQIHAAHGFLLSQFLSPLFNQRTDAFGGALTNRMHLLMETIEAVRDAVGPRFPLAVKLNASDQLQGGLTGEDALQVVAALDATSLDLIDISGGTYFPGARAASEGASRGPYFLEFAQSARPLTKKPLMVTGGFKTLQQARDARAKGVDCIGLARALVLSPSLPKAWHSGQGGDPDFPTFADPPEGGITAWYTMRLTALGENATPPGADDLPTALSEYDARDRKRIALWQARFSA